MIEKFDKNNNLESLEQNALLSRNYIANDDYINSKSHRHIKFWSFLI